MRKTGRYVAVVIAITVVFLANTVSAVFHPLPLAENQNTKLLTNENSTLNPDTSRSGFHSIPEEIKNQNSKSSFLDFWKSGVNTSESGFKGVSGCSDFVSKDNDSMELVIGVNTAHPNVYNSLVERVSSVWGKVVNTVSIKDEVIAIVADVPLNAVSSLVKDVQTSNLAQYVEPNMKFQAQFIPNDPYWASQWGPQKIEADYAWNTTTGNHSVIVAVIDTGIDYNHPDLSENYVALGHDWVNNDTNPLDDNGHGTHCAGIIAAVLNNAVGIAGIANVSIMAEKGLDANGSGSEDDLANAIYDAVDKGADILSNSWGGYGVSQLIYDAVRYAYEHGVLVIAAAGNDAVDAKLIPAAYDEVIAVTATDSSDYPAGFTNFGDWVEVAAPGVDIYSTLPTYHVTLNDYGYSMNYDYLSGTSMACPHAAGVAALIWSQFPNATRDWVRAQLRYTGDDLGDPGFDKYYGYGRINAKNAVEQVPPEHDLLIFDWERPPYIKVGEPATFNITALNFGVSDETDVEVHLLVNGSSVDSTSIALLQGDISTTVSLSWTPTTGGMHNVTYYVVPTANETIIQNNQITEILYVITPPSEANWILLATDPDEGAGSNLKSIYGQVCSDIIYFKVEYHRSWITINDIDTAIFIDADQDASTGLPDGAYPGQNTGIGADYVIVVGWEATEMWKWDPVAGMWDIRNPISLAYLEAPENSSAFVVGVFFASVETSGIVDCAVVDIPSNWDWMPNSGYFTWILIHYEHELAVLLKTPLFLQPGENSLINATVCNRGLNNETNVKIQLLINGTEVANKTLTELVNGTCYTLSYSWTPTVQGIYNVTAYAPPVPSENFTMNNINTKFVSVHSPLINPEPGQYANYVMNYYDSSGRPVGQQGYLNLTYEYYIEPYKIYVTVWEKDPSGYIGTGWMIVNTMTRLVESGNIWTGWWYPGWIETDINIGSTINLMDGTATVSGTRMLVFGPRAIDCWEIPHSMYGYPYTFWYDKRSGLWIGMESINPYTGERIELLLIYTNVPIGIQYEHDLGVTLDAPLRLQPGETSMLSATVYNLGLNNETSVKIQILINGTEVASETLGKLVNGTSYTISYYWTPISEGVYNVTAYAPPVSGEDVKVNNAATKMVRVRTFKGYVLFDQTHWTDSISYYSIWVNNLTDRGYAVDTLTISPITPSTLEGYDVFVIPQAHDYYSSSELTAIQNFVINGGGLLIIGDDVPYVYSDLTRFDGITWDWGGNWGYTSDITPHPVTEGVNTVYFDSPGKIYVSLSAQDLIRDQYKNIMLAVSEVGAGAVIGIADENSVINWQIGIADNLRLANNMIDWLMSRPPKAFFTYSPLDPYAGETVTFNASASYDPDGTIVSYSWDFGDGATGGGVVTTHMYAAGGTYTVKLTATDNEGLNTTVTKEITVLRTTLDVLVKVGSIHFRGEKAEFYVLVSSLGKPVDASIRAILYYNGILYQNMSTSVEHVSLGLSRIPYTIPIDASTGTYAMVVEASYLSLRGISIESFLLSPTLTGWNALLVNINGTVGTVKTDLGLFEVKLDAINATLVSVTEKTVTISSTLGLIQTDIGTINARLTAINKTVVTIQTDLGTIMMNITDIQLKVTAINGTTATIQTTLGVMNGTITRIDNNTATILTPIGNIEADISSLKGAQETWIIPQYAIIIIALIAAVSSTLALFFVRRRKP